MHVHGSEDGSSEGVYEFNKNAYENEMDYQGKERYENMQQEREKLAGWERMKEKIEMEKMVRMNMKEDVVRLEEKKKCMPKPSLRSGARSE